MAKNNNKPRNEKIVSRFNSQEMAQVEELRQRVNISTYGKMVRVILLSIAKNPEFDFLALGDLPEDIVLISKVAETLTTLNNQGLFNEDGEEAEK